MPTITPHVCRHTYCSNQAKAGMNPKTLQYLMGHSDIGVTMNVYTHLGLDDAKEEMIRMEELEQARREVEKTEDVKAGRVQSGLRGNSPGRQMMLSGAVFLWRKKVYCAIILTTFLEQEGTVCSRYKKGRKHNKHHHKLLQRE